MLELEKNSPLTFTILSDPEIAMPGRFLDLSEKRIMISTPEPAGVGQPVQIEASNTLWLGEVRDCQPALGEFEVRVDITHVLEDLAELARLSERFTGRPATDRPVIPIPALSN